MMHYTTKEARVNEFLTLIANNELCLEGSTVRGAQMLVPLETESLKLGRSSNPPRSQVAVVMTPPPTRNWFEHIFKRV